MVPAALLAAAVIVAGGGGGADALSSLKQLTSGPDVPPTPVDLVSPDAPVGADIGHLDGQLLAVTRSRPGFGSAGAGSAGAVGAAPVTGSGGPADQGASPVAAAPPAGPAPAGGGPSQEGAAPTPGPAPSSGAPSSPVPSGPNPLPQVLDGTQQQLEDLVEPVRPITDGLLGGAGRR